MVHLKYIDNPFDAKTMYSISCFSEEKSFYDCVNRRFLNDQSFQHLEHSFYTYFLTGDCGEWIGYVLLSNENRVNGYYHFACQKILDLLSAFKNKFDDSINEQELERLKRLINENSNSSSISTFLEEVILSLKKMAILDSLNSYCFEVDNQISKEELEKLKVFMSSNRNVNDIKMMIEEVFVKLNQLGVVPIQVINKMIADYYIQLQQYLLQFPEYLYLDVVIALPMGEEINIKKKIVIRN